MATLIMSLFLWSINTFNLNPLISIFVKIIIGVLVYVSYSLYFSKKEISWFLEQTKWLKQKK